ncbi:helix-turn-helix transcriptional regulator [Paracoccus sp. AS002]|uniref:helix-turn-helix domain-containing protein n=1 Tax=Paracoccus sp. AS002 TaxID=3019545 RepID=UPI0023E8B59E|nr:helix-turn-helix transcriptional regulator [Paracoccus sp. AS002]MDF3907616.1 helix-turn-helix transcriptional regulator [Paracoccus sp. AS002]
MDGKLPEAAVDFSFDDDDLDWDDWITADFDSPDVQSERAPVAPVGAILKQIRQQIGPKGISQKEMAERLGIPKRTYISYETQETAKVPAEVLRRIAATTDVDAEFILTGRTRYIDHGPILDDAFRLAEHLAKHIHDGEERLSYNDIQEVVIRVLAEREERRQLTGNPSAQYTRGDIADAVWEHTEYSLRYRRALAEAPDNGR